MSSIDINSFVKILTNGLKFYLKNEKVKIEESDFQILEMNYFLNFLFRISTNHKPQLNF